MRKWLAMLLLAALWLGGMPVPAAAEELSLHGPSAVLMTETGEILLEKDAHTAREPASVTKVMTLLLICEAVDEGRMALEDMVTASAHAASMGGSQIWLEEGEQLSVSDMLKCVAVVSANDCAVALGEHLSGSEEAFVRKMNDRARELGMRDTHFVNACGLPAEGHMTSAFDIGLMSAALLRNHPWISDYTTIWQDSVREGASELTNTNRLVRFYEGATGLKTGYTSSAGYCLSATAERDGLPLIAVVLGCKTRDDRTEDIRRLLDHGFANYAAVTLTPDRPLLPVPVTLGERESVTVRLAQPEPLVLRRESLTGLEKTVCLPERLDAPIREGQQLGALSVRSAEGELCRIPLLAEQDVPRLGLAAIFGKTFASVCCRGQYV